MKRVLMVLPDYWARLQLAHSLRWRERFEVVFADPSNEDCPWDFDAVAYAETIAQGNAREFAGVTSSSDYPGAQVAAAIATALGKSGSAPQASLTCAHKYYARLACQSAAPEATPEFSLFEVGVAPKLAPACGFPCFVKPVKGSFSVQAKRIESSAQLQDYLLQPFLIDYGKRYLHTFNRMLRHYTDFEFDGRYALCEGLLRGAQATIEGWVWQGEVGFIGVTDSVMHPGTRSFTRFEYPSSLPTSVQARMAEIAGRVISRVGLNQTLWNIEMFYDPGSDRISIIEINPRMASQFADLYEKVEGVNGFEVALMLAAGEKPFIPRAGQFKYAASVPLRVFADTRVLRVPSEARIRDIEAAHPGTIVWWECKAGDRLSPKAEFEDGASMRYGVINLGAQSRDKLALAARDVESALGAAMEKVAGAEVP